MIALFAPAYRLEGTGVGVRASELALALAPHIDVAVVTRGGSERRLPGVRVYDAADEPVAREVLDKAEAVVFYDLPDTRELLRLHRKGTLLICENAPPIEHLEFEAIRAAPDPDAAHRDLVARYELQVLLCDHFLVQSEVARATLIASLGHVGRLTRSNYERSPNLQHLLSWLPLGFSDVARREAEQATPQDPFDFAWSGGLWDYYDPMAVVRAVERLIGQGRPVSVRFLYPPPAGQELREARRLRAALQAPGLQAHVRLADQAPEAADRDGMLLSARAAVCIAKPGIENATCVRLRLRDTLLYRLPLVVDPFGATGTQVRALGIGLVVDPSDTVGLADALDALARDTALRARLMAGIEAARGDYLLDTHVLPLVEFVRARRHAPDIGTPDHERRLEAFLERHPDVTSAPRYPW